MNIPYWLHVMRMVALTGPMPVCHLAIGALIVGAIVIFEQWRMPLMIGVPAFAIWFAACCLRIGYKARAQVIASQFRQSQNS
ncbi:TPA: hypothetical protein RY214_004793 [Pseudomonas aeruginosa]|uniref:hypothetical protein n=1 Tax=Pseudomonas aeruginosa group TaxID=136841 RepID=UPI000CFD0CAF|nr:MULTISPECIES: hypothetical protein [Pseudomonas aeruginosa group]EKX0430346.1 hypothetical protein [Pseudomonas aeruginosa]MCV0038350.1 hypothetical protein [Pseudomonas aeruginosa]HCE5829628.1 hypothetical protein [Pseudomonas aeruginosa]HCF7071149.1 hypothetical protein [Pseudomonas aeruginosa]HCT5749753.1 hypothetical protein [Pseudomonas aeruginosa]